jgi:hypothetical protein
MVITLDYDYYPYFWCDDEHDAPSSSPPPRDLTLD